MRGTVGQPMATVRSFLYRGAESPCCPLWGWCSAQRIKIVMIAGGNHTSVSCRDSGKGGAVGIFELLPFNEPHPLSQPVRAASSPIGEPSFPCCPRWGKCRDSGKGGGVGSFEPLPSNEPHPLSQAVRPASSPIGEPSFPCCPRWGKCRAAAKGVPLVTLGCYHSTNHTPSATR